LQGDFAQETVYGDDPAEMARRWEAEGASRLHVVDLDGARDGVRQNAAVVAKLLNAVSIPVQIGGGIRTIETARELLDAGVDRVVVGTTAAEHSDQLTGWVADLGAERIVIGVDTRDDFVVTRGWLEKTQLTTAAFCETLRAAGIVRILFTDVGRDGMLEGPNLEAIQKLVQTSGLQVIASGGVSSVADLQALAEAGAEGAITGKALYDGRIRLADALSASRLAFKMAEQVGPRDPE
jgi:phosphoribosylformimino-5-aminoimidazole carboxamide ribotide isomerase